MDFFEQFNEKNDEFGLTGNEQCHSKRFLDTPSD